MRFKIIFFLLIFISGELIAQNKIHLDTLQAKLYFKVGTNVVLSDTSGLKELVKNVLSISAEPKYEIEKVMIDASSSIDGYFVPNYKLSVLRSKKAFEILRQNLYFNDSLFVIKSIGEDWKGLRRLVSSSDLKNQQKILNIIDNLPENTKMIDSWKKNLKNFNKGQSWKFMAEKYFPELRCANIYIVYSTLQLDYIDSPNIVYDKDALVQQDKDTTVVSNQGIQGIDTTSDKDSIDFVQTTQQNNIITDNTSKKKPFYIGVKNNLLYDLALLPNIGLEVYLGKNLSLLANWHYAWWFNDAKHFYWQTYGGDMELRYWFSKKKKPLTGLHAGVYGQIITWDFEFGNKGNQAAKWNYGGGIAVGYSLPIARRLNIDFNIGLGYLGGKYEKYYALGDFYPWISTHKLIYFGPTKAEISLVWLIGRGNYNRRSK